MKQSLLFITLIATTFVLLSCDKLTDQPASAPTITAQGFHITAVQEGTVENFQSIRLRVECPAGLQKLQIQERSYDVDLASTPERSHFQLFGLDRKVLLNKDITLDFQQYINSKLKQPGEYTILIKATDKQNQSTSANIRLQVVESASKSEPIPPESSFQNMPDQAVSPQVRIRPFEIQRIGPRAVEGEKTFGLQWKTIDANQVTISVKKGDPGVSKLSRLNIKEYDNIVTQDNLTQALALAVDQEHVVFDTADNAAAGVMLGIVRMGKPYVLKSNQSTTVLTDVGTTVTLRGEYKY